MRKRLAVLSIVAGLSICSAGVALADEVTIEAGSVWPGVYTVGEDIEANNYIFTCVDEYAEVAVFKDADAYDTFLRSERFNGGDYGDALSANTISTAWPNHDGTCSLNLVDGNILYIENGYGTLSYADGSEFSSDETVEDVMTVSDGVYYPGSLDVGTYAVRFSETDDNYSIGVLEFQNETDYDTFNENKGDTVGEEDEAKRASEYTSRYLYKDGIIFLSVDDDDVVVISGGSAELKRVTMPWMPTK